MGHVVGEDRSCTCTVDGDGSGRIRRWFGSDSVWYCDAEICVLKTLKKVTRIDCFVEGYYRNFQLIESIVMIIFMRIL